MKPFVLLLVFASSVIAYDLAGAYERVLFYYAYLADTNSGTRPSTKIAVGCNSKRACSFDEFVKYIAQPGQITVNVNPAGQYPDVESTANALKDSQTTGQVEPSKVIAGASDYSSLLTRLRDTLAGITPNAPQGIKDGLAKASQGTARARMSAFYDEVDDAMKNPRVPGAGPFPNGLTRQDIPIFDGALRPSNPPTKRALIKETIKNNRGLTRAILYGSKDDPGYAKAGQPPASFFGQAGDPSHDTNRRVTEDAADMLCKYRKGKDPFA
ncbi:hypothetical protein PRZ48_006745 [Zasmidium cellare]|uniref:Uncharacterized protein n=1 Tax=Zasmidium cellare TaxID=395010 RepID=A0ABR0EPC1_ZASCE|nr:hypothetical protein PRZ48_006745 [Zasmidium cellare]